MKTAIIRPSKTGAMAASWRAGPQFSTADGTGATSVHYMKLPWWKKKTPNHSKVTLSRVPTVEHNVRFQDQEAHPRSELASRVNFGSSPLMSSRDPGYCRGDRVTMLVATATRASKLKKPYSSLDLNQKHGRKRFGRRIN
jgi:hypothetical protein